MSNGGYAFPVPNSANVNGQEGMTLRDYFAAKAINGLCAYHGTNGHGVVGSTQTSPDVAAKRAYEIADAMIAARGKDGA